MPSQLTGLCKSFTAFLACRYAWGIATVSVFPLAITIMGSRLPASVHSVAFGLASGALSCSDSVALAFVHTFGRDWPTAYFIDATVMFVVAIVWAFCPEVEGHAPPNPFREILSGLLDTYRLFFSYFISAPSVWACCILLSFAFGSGYGLANLIQLWLHNDLDQHTLNHS